MAGRKVNEFLAAILFNRHEALFLDKADDDGIFPRMFLDRNELDVHASFEAFYASNIVYHMTDQWITRKGPFVYDFRWLSNQGTQQQLKDFADGNFANAYGVHPDNARLL